MSLIAGNLGSVQRLLDEADLPWGVCAGAAAYVYGVRRPIENVDILLCPGALRRVRELLEQHKWAAQYDGRILLWRGIKVFDDLTVTAGRARYPFVLDGPMQERLRRQPLLGCRVLVLSPEDVVVHKALLVHADNALGKHHRSDVETLVRVQREQLDTAYLLQRLDACKAGPQVRAFLAEAGLNLPL